MEPTHSNIINSNDSLRRPLNMESSLYNTISSTKYTPDTYNNNNNTIILQNNIINYSDNHSNYMDYSFTREEFHDSKVVHKNKKSVKSLTQNNSHNSNHQSTHNYSVPNVLNEAGSSTSVYKSPISSSSKLPNLNKIVSMPTGTTNKYGVYNPHVVIPSPPSNFPSMKNFSNQVSPRLEAEIPIQQHVIFNKKNSLPIPVPSTAITTFKCSSSSSPSRRSSSGSPVGTVDKKPPIVPKNERDLRVSFKENRSPKSSQKKSSKSSRKEKERENYENRNLASKPPKVGASASNAISSSKNSSKQLEREILRMQKNARDFGINSTVNQLDHKDDDIVV